MRRGSERRVRAARAVESEEALLARALGTPAPPRLAWSDAGFDVVAEVKRRAPSAGVLAPGTAVADASRRAAAYAAAGAAAISVLTEPDEFGGSLDDLAAVARTVGTAAMRKDFLVGPYQVLEARAAGAAGALVIVRMLDDRTIDGMVEAARRTGLFLLLEAFDERDLDRAGEARERAGEGVDLPVGLNARDLRTLEVDLERLARLAARFPEGAVRVAESGVARPADAARLAAAGYRAALVGSALMREADPAPLVRAMIDAGRTAAARRSCVSE
jgi:indole-3-glycerol phosphate synthase